MNIIASRNFKLFQRGVAASSKQRSLRFIDESCVRRSDVGYNMFWGPKGVTPSVVSRGPHGGSCTVFGITSINRAGNSTPIVSEVISRGITKEYFAGVLDRFGRAGLFEPYDIIVLDNAAPHLKVGSEEYNALCEALWRRWRVTLVRLPTYSPELNPIELVWNMLKRKLRAMPGVPFSELPRVVTEILATVTFEAVKGAMKHQGYF